MSFINRQQKQLKPYEARFFYNWSIAKGKQYFYKLRNAPEVVLNEYKQDLADKCTGPVIDNDTTRLNAIKLYIEFTIDIYPSYKKLNRSIGVNGMFLGMLLNYSSPSSWHGSYKKQVYIRAIMAYINKHEELLSRLNGEK